MSIDARLTTLDQRRRTVKSEIAEELRRPHFDEIRVHDLKRQNLALKDEITPL